MTVLQPATLLQGERVTLRAWEPSDAEWYVRARDEEVFRWTKEARGLTVDAARLAIEAQRREPAWVALAITSPDTGELLGNLALTLKDAERTGEVMYWLAPQARGRGAATEAVSLIVRWAFETLPIDLIDLYTKVGNEASQAVARRCQFEHRGQRRGEEWFVLTREAHSGRAPVRPNPRP
jgi:RimJ/RimL family protein N-acetyltransferase